MGAGRLHCAGQSGLSCRPLNNFFPPNSLAPPCFLPSTAACPAPPPHPTHLPILPLPLQVYYELAAERAKQGKQGEVALIRMEQLAPFPFDLVMRELRRYPNAGAWCACVCLCLFGGRWGTQMLEDLFQPVTSPHCSPCLQLRVLPARPPAWVQRLCGPRRSR